MSQNYKKNNMNILSMHAAWLKDGKRTWGKNLSNINILVINRIRENKEQLKEELQLESSKPN